MRGGRDTSRFEADVERLATSKAKDKVSLERIAWLYGAPHFVCTLLSRSVSVGGADAADKCGAACSRFEANF